MRLSLLAAGLLALAGLLLRPLPARAVVDFCDLAQFPSCLRDFGSCEFDLDYGSTGGALLLGALRVDGVGTLINPQIEAQTGLTLECAAAGEGTGLMRITTRLRNETGSASPPLRYFAFVDPDGNTLSQSMQLLDVPGVSFAGGAGDPTAFGIDELGRLDDQTPGNLDHEMFTIGSLSNTSYCGAFCNVVFALQLEIGPILPGRSAAIELGFSDTGQALSPSFLFAARADDFGAPDDPTTVLTFSGRIAGTSIPALPLPAALLLSLLAVGLVARRA